MPSIESVQPSATDIHGIDGTSPASGLIQDQVDHG